MRGRGPPRKLTLQVAGAEEEEEERLLSTRLYQNLNLLFLNDQALENQSLNLPFKRTLKHRQLKN
jgi:hypothetical protein